MNTGHLILVLTFIFANGHILEPSSPRQGFPLQECGDDLCICHGHTANCSGRGLTYIPLIKPIIWNIDLSDNNFRSLSVMSFDNISSESIKILNISFCQIKHLASNTFEDLIHLETLVMNHNPVCSSDFTVAMAAAPFHHLTTLHLGELFIRDSNFLKNMTLPRLKYLYMDHNNLTVYDQSLFSESRKLVKVSARGNKIGRLQFSYSQSLISLHLDMNVISPENLTSFCNGNSTYFPRLRNLNLPYNMLSDINTIFECLPNVNPIGTLTTNAFIKLPSLKHLYLRSLYTHPPIEAYAFNSSQMYFLALTNSHIDFDNHVDDSAFKGLNVLSMLDVSANKFRTVSEEKMMTMFGHLKKLKNIAMGSCQLEAVPKYIDRLNRLIGVSLYQNRITILPDNLLENLVNLRKLWLDQNSITNIKESTIPAKIRNHLEVINLGNNPFNCDCNLRWFIDWTTRQNTIFQQFPSQYICNSPSEQKHKLLKNIHFSINSCFLPFTTIAAVLGMSVVFIIVLTLLSILYKLRWRIRYYIYVNYHRQRQRHDLENAPEYVYDAYIIDSEEDEDWVVEEMLPRLEDQDQMRLCIPSRDFLPGTYILNNIDEAIQTSRHIVVVLSPSCVESEWCQAELTMAQSFVLDTRGNPLLVVVLEEPDARNMRHSLHVLLRSTAYIIWEEEEEARQLFWRRLVESLRPDENNLRN